MSDLKRVLVQPVVRGRVAIFDRGPDYKDGELFIKWGATQEDPPDPVEAPLTPAVSLAVGRRKLTIIEISEPEPEEVEVDDEEPKKRGSS